MLAAAPAGILLLCGNPNTILHLMVEELRVSRFALSRLEKQRAIVGFLDGAASQTDALIQRINLSVDRLRDYRAVLTFAAATGKLDMREASR